MDQWTIDLCTTLALFCPIAFGFMEVSARQPSFPPYHYLDLKASHYYPWLVPLLTLSIPINTQTMQPGAEPLYLCFLAVVFAVASAETSQVQWISPSAGDHFGPGDNILGKWSASKAISAPSFKLCTGAGQSSIKMRDEDNNGGTGRCGAKVYPTVQQDNGVYLASL